MEAHDARYDASSEVSWKRSLIPKAGLKPRADGLGHQECSDGHHVLSESPMNMLDVMGSMARTAVGEKREPSDDGSHPSETNATYQPQHGDDEIY